MGFRALCVVLGALLLAGCGGAALTAQQQENVIRHSFQLNVWEESLVGGGSAEDVSIWVTQEAGWVTVDINVTGARNLSAFYFDLGYDAALLAPSGVNFTDRIAAPKDRIEQVDISASGRVVAGESAKLLTGRSSGFTGTGRIARVLFRKRQP